MRTFPVLGVVTMSLRHLQRPGFHLNGYAPLCQLRPLGPS